MVLITYGTNYAGVSAVAGIANTDHCSRAVIANSVRFTVQTSGGAIRQARAILIVILVAYGTDRT